MQLYDAYELMDAHTASDATRLIQQEGWTLLSTVGTAHSVVYVLGKPKPRPERNSRERRGLAQLGEELG